MAGVMLRASLLGSEGAEVHFPGAEWRGSSFNVVVSEVDGSDFPGQVREALAYLELHSTVVRELLNHPGAEAPLDFGLWKNVGPSQSVSIPAELAMAAGALGLGLDLSLYAVDE